MDAMQTYASEVQAAILQDSTIQDMIGEDWVEVWGPVVFSMNEDTLNVVADNTMGCYFSPSENLFVIAVAGTNPSSSYDWLTEDLAVSTTTSWEGISGVAASGDISTGTATGLNNLLTMTDSANSNTMLEAISAYIQNNTVSNAAVAVTGHSLAGALAPVLALYMVEQASEWDPTSAISSVGAYPTAGPTPGDNDFASYFEGQVSAGNISCTSQYNSLDVVPLAWAEADLGNIPMIYNANITPVNGSQPENLLLGLVICGMQYEASGGAAAIAANRDDTTPNNYTQLTRTELTGTFDAATDLEAGLGADLVASKMLSGAGFAAFSPYFTNLLRFGAQAIYQHTKAYPKLLNITAFNTEYQQILTADAPTARTASPRDAIVAAVKRRTGIDFGAIRRAA